MTAIILQHEVDYFFRDNDLRTLDETDIEYI